MPLCKVAIFISFLALHIVFLNQSGRGKKETPVSIVDQMGQGHGNVLFNVLLDFRKLQHTTSAGGFDHFRHQLRVRDGLTALHDSDNRCLRLVVPISGNPLVRALVLLLGFLKLDLIDLDAHLGIGEARIVGEYVGVVHIFALGVLRKHSVPGTSQ